MENKFAYVMFLLFACGIAQAWDIEDVNGTYLDEEEYLESPLIREKNYSWGKGANIPETSIEFDLGTKEVRIPGYGLYHIDSVYKDAEGSICLVLIYIADKEKEDPFNMKVSFIDYERAYIVYDKWERYSARSYSPKEKWVWYRLSGPKK
jgi:hypothetical protein